MMKKEINNKEITKTLQTNEWWVVGSRWWLERGKEINEIRVTPKTVLCPTWT